MFDFEKLKSAVADLDEDAAYEIIDAVMADGGTEADRAMAACQEGLDEVGKLFSDGTYFIGDLIFAGELMTEAVTKMRSALVKNDGNGKKGRMILCTVAGDLHDIGKNIVRAFLEASGFEVLDLGIDVPASKIVDTAIAEDIHIIALSGVLTLAIDSMREVIDICKERGIRDQYKIIIGGNPVSAEICTAIGADAWAHDPQDTVKACKGWL